MKAFITLAKDINFRTFFTDENIELAEDFLSFLEEDKAKSIFENAGFGIK